MNEKAYDRSIKSLYDKSPFSLLPKSLFPESFDNKDIEKVEDLKSKLTYTVERKPDFLQKIYTRDGKRLILHMEYQSRNDKEMHLRMFEYYAMTIRQHPNTPIRQVVIYFGAKKCNMKAQVQLETGVYAYKLIDFQKLPYEELLASEDPRTVILAILGHYGDKKAKEVLKSTTKRLFEVEIKTKIRRKLLSSMNILARLRTDEEGINLSESLDKITKDMPLEFDIENDTLYKKGMEKGVEKGMEKGEKRGIQLEKVEFVKCLINLNLPTREIMKHAKVDEVFIQKVVKGEFDEN